MAFLHALEGIRFPALDAVMSFVTYLGDETCFMALALILFWCVSKRQAYYLFAVGFFGTALAQFMKLWFRIPRPWVLDPGFTIVEAARAGASDYSFPSGHTLNIVGTLGTVAICNRQKWVRILCLVFVILVPFSRMYLGVHTPLDVSVAFVLAIVLLIVLRPCFCSEERFTKTTPWVMAVLAVCIALYGIFVLTYAFPADVDAGNLASGTKNAFTMGGVALGLILSYFYDRRVLHFDTKAPLPGQLLKLVLGLALIMAIRIGLKAPLSTLFHGSHMATLVRYFLMVLFAGCIWPHTFPLWAKIGRKN